MVSHLTSWFAQLPTILMGLMGLVMTGISSFLSTLAAQLPTMLPVLAASVMGMLNDLVTQVMTDLPTYITQLVAAAVQFFHGIADAIPVVIPIVVAGIGDLVSTVLTNLPSFVGQLIGAAVALFTGIASAIPKVVPAVLSGIADLLGQIFDAVANFDLVQAGKDLVSGLANGITAAGQGVIDAIGGVVGGAIDWAKGLLGIASPSKLFRSFGEYTMQGYAIGVERDEGSAVGAVKGALEDVAGLSAPSFEPPASYAAEGASASDARALETLHEDLLAILSAIPRGMTKREFDRAVVSAYANA